MRQKNEKESILSGDCEKRGIKEKIFRIIKPVVNFNFSRVRLMFALAATFFIAVSLQGIK